MSPYTLYEIQQVGYSDAFGIQDIRILPVTVIDENVAPGARVKTIVAVGADGRRFRGVERDYFKTEADARESAVAELREWKLRVEREIEERKQELESVKRVLASIATS